MNIVHLTGLQPWIQRDQLLDYPYDGASDISKDKAFLPQVASCQCVFTARREWRTCGVFPGHAHSLVRVSGLP